MENFRGKKCKNRTSYQLFTGLIVAHRKACKEVVNNPSSRFGRTYKICFQRGTRGEVICSF